jgi:uncharacterized protein
MTHHGIEIPKERLAEFCRRNSIAKLSLFGSILRDDFRPESDIDMLVEFEPGHRIGLLALAGLEIELAAMLGRKVDLRTPAELSRYFRDEVVSAAELQYGQR